MFLYVPRGIRDQSGFVTGGIELRLLGKVA